MDYLHVQADNPWYNYNIAPRSWYVHSFIQSPAAKTGLLLMRIVLASESSREILILLHVNNNGALQPCQSNDFVIRTFESVIAKI